MVIRAEDIADALTDRDDEHGESNGETTRTRGVLPTNSPRTPPRPDQHKPPPGRLRGDLPNTAAAPRNRGTPTPSADSLPDPGGDGTDDG